MQLHDENQFFISRQPKQNCRYRSAFEFHNYHGVITGQPFETNYNLRFKTSSSSNERTFYPEVKLVLPAEDNKRKFFVLCTLHNGHNTDAKEQNITDCISPHVLLRKGEPSINCRQIFEEMLENPNSSRERFWQLRDYFIGRMGQREYRNSITKKENTFKELNLPIPFQRFIGNLNIDDDTQLKEAGGFFVTLGFTVFEQHKGHDDVPYYTLHRPETIYSNVIYNGDALQIEFICNKIYDVAGGDDITLLVNLKSGYRYQVVMKEIDVATKSTVWQAQVDPVKIYRNSLIRFSCPAYTGPSMSKDEILIHMYVVAEDSSYRSKPAKFIFTNYDKRKRPRRSTDVNLNMRAIQEHDDDDGNMPAMNPKLLFLSSDFCSSELKARKNDLLEVAPFASSKGVKVWQKETTSQKLCKTLELIFKKDTENFKNSNIRGLTNKDSNTIFHEAIKDCTALLKMYKEAANQSHIKCLIVEARNFYHENLLHYACFLNLPERIRPLIGMGCSMVEQDFQGRTPLHIALKYKYSECLQEMQNLLKDHSRYSAEVHEQLLAMFKVYNEYGYTVLHEVAADGTIPELFRTMLAFCKKYEFDVFDYEVLGSGDSVMHIIAKHNHIDLMKIAKELLPNSMTITNYAGETVLENEECLSKEMQEVLAANI